MAIAFKSYKLLINLGTRKIFLMHNLLLIMVITNK